MPLICRWASILCVIFAAISLASTAIAGEMGNEYVAALFCVMCVILFYGAAFFSDIQHDLEMDGMPQSEDGVEIW